MPVTRAVKLSRALYPGSDGHRMPDIAARLGTAANPLTSTAAIVPAKNPVLRRSPFAGMLFNGKGRDNLSRLASDYPGHDPEHRRHEIWTCPDEDLVDHHDPGR